MSTSHYFHMHDKENSVRELTKVCFIMTKIYEN